MPSHFGSRLPASPTPLQLQPIWGLPTTAAFGKFLSHDGGGETQNCDHGFVNNILLS